MSRAFAQGFWPELWQTGRTLARKPGFTLLSVLTIAIGVASSATIFAFVDAVMLKALPYQEPSRIVRILERNPEGATTWISTPDYLDWREQNTVFETLGAQQQGLATLQGGDSPQALRIMRVTADYFSVFGERALLGRTFVEGDDAPGSAPLAVLSYPLWQTRFEGDPALIGKAIIVDQTPYTVVGVLSPDSPFNRGTAELWYPVVLDTATQTREYRWINASFARLKPGVSLEQARAEMDAIGARIAQAYPDTHRGWGVAVEAYADSIVGPSLRSSLLTLAAAVGGLLLICCSNLASLGLARAVARRLDVAVRSSLGASPTRIMRQILTEAALIALCGGTLGVALAAAGVVTLRSLLATGTLPIEAHVALDVRTGLFAAGIAVLIGIVIGIAPALGAARQRIATQLRAGTRSTAVSVARRRWLDGLIVAQIAVAFILLCGSGLLIRSFATLLSVDTGFDTRDVLTMNLPLQGFPPGSVYTDAEEFKTYLRDLETTIAAVPGVREVGFTSALPLTDCCLYNASFEIEGQPRADRASRSTSSFKVVTPSYFAALGVTLLRGRLLDARDRDETAPTIVINERMAERYFAGADPIGRRIVMAKILPGKTQRGSEVASEVVGVVGNEKITDLEDDTTNVIYASYEQSPVYFVNLVVQAEQDAGALAGVVSDRIWRVDRGQGIRDVRTLERIESQSVASERLWTTLLTVFSSAALLLAAVGIYGVLSYSIAQRRQEIGVRAALGASHRSLRWLVYRHGFRLTAVGLVIGLGGALGLTQLLAGILYHVNPRDPQLFTLAVVLVLAVTLLATTIPARRAAATDPVTALGTP